MTSSPAPAAPSTGILAANLNCVASMAIWAAGLVAATSLIPLLPALQLTFLRLSLSALALVLFWAALEGPRALWRAGWLRGIAVGSLIGVGAWCLILGQSRTNAVTVAVISAMLPVVGLAIEVVLDGRRLTAGLVIGILLSLVGGLFALDLSAGLSFGIGALFCLASVTVFAFGSRLTVSQFPRLTALGQTTVTLTGASLATLVLALADRALGAPAFTMVAFGAEEWARLLVFSVGALGISQVFWIMSVGRIGIGLSAIHINAAPFYVMLITFALGGGWSWPQAFGALIVGIGVLVAQGVIPFRKAAS